MLSALAERDFAVVTFRGGAIRRIKKMLSRFSQVGKSA
jgi:hypothetical protein